MIYKNFLLLINCIEFYLFVCRKKCNISSTVLVMSLPNMCFLMGMLSNEWSLRHLIKWRENSVSLASALEKGSYSTTTHHFAFFPNTYNWSLHKLKTNEMEVMHLYIYVYQTSNFNLFCLLNFPLSYMIPTSCP